MGAVNITLGNGSLGGSLQTNDGIAGLVMTGAIDGGGYALGTPVLVTGMVSVATAGITADNAFAIKQLTEFYAEAGDGAQLYVMLVVNTMTAAQICDPANADGAKKLLDYAAGKIKLLGVLTDDAHLAVAPVIAQGLNGDVYAALGNAQALAIAYFAKEQPFRALLGATSYNGAPGDLTDLSSYSDHDRVGIVLGDTVSGSGAAVGLALGRLASDPVMRKMSRVKTGALTINAAFLGTNAFSQNDATVIAGKYFITFKTYANQAGIYFSGDDTASLPTDDYHFIARGRTIDKAHVLAYTVFVQVVDDEVPVNTDGTLDAGFCKYLEQQIVNQINTSMKAGGEISSVTCTIDPTQNILSSNELNVVIKIVPVGYATDIEISLGFDNPANG